MPIDFQGNIDANREVVDRMTNPHAKALAEIKLAIAEGLVQGEAFNPNNEVQVNQLFGHLASLSSDKRIKGDFTAAESIVTAERKAVAEVAKRAAAAPLIARLKASNAVQRKSIINRARIAINNDLAHTPERKRAALGILDDAIRFEEADRKAHVTDLQKQVTDGNLTKEQARALAVDPGAKEDINKAFHNEDKKQILDDLNAGKIDEATARANAGAITPELQDEINKKINLKADDQVFKDFTEGRIDYNQLKNYVNVSTNTDLKERFKKAGEVHAQGRAQEIAPAGANFDVAEVKANVQALPEWGNLPSNIQAEISATLDSFDGIQTAVIAADAQALNRMRAELNLANAEQFDVQWERFKRRAKMVGKVTPVVLLALMLSTGAGAGLGAGGGTLGAVFGGGAGLGMGVVASGAVGLGIYGVREKYINRKVRAQEDLAIAKSQEAVAQIEAKLKMEEKKTPAKRSLERKKFLAEQAAQVVAGGNKEVSLAQAKKAIKDASGVDILENMVKALEQYMGSVQYVNNSVYKPA